MKLLPRVLSADGKPTSHRIRPKATARQPQVFSTASSSPKAIAAVATTGATARPLALAPNLAIGVATLAAETPSATSSAARHQDILGLDVAEDSGELAAPPQVHYVRQPEAHADSAVTPLAHSTELVPDPQLLLSEMRVLRQLLGQLLAALPAAQAASRPRAKQAGLEFLGGQRLLDIDAVCEVVRASRSTVYEWLKSGTFVPPIKTGKRSVRYRESDVLEWIQKRSAETPAKRS